MLNIFTIVFLGSDPDISHLTVNMLKFLAFYPKMQPVVYSNATSLAYWFFYHFSAVVMERLL